MDGHPNQHYTMNFGGMGQDQQHLQLQQQQARLQQQQQDYPQLFFNQQNPYLNMQQMIYANQQNIQQQSIDMQALQRQQLLQAALNPQHHLQAVQQQQQQHQVQQQLLLDQNIAAAQVNYHFRNVFILVRSVNFDLVRILCYNSNSTLRLSSFRPVFSNNSSLS
jgi:hypothetical protein